MRIRFSKLNRHGGDMLRSVLNEISTGEYAGNLTFKREPEQRGNFWHFTLTVNDSSEPGSKRTPQGRRVAAACWHAHRDVMVRLFELDADALLITALARYEGRESFEDQFEATGDQLLGSLAFPKAFRNCCECSEAV